MTRVSPTHIKTLEEHIACGNAIKAAVAQLRQVIMRPRARTSRAVRAAVRAERALLRLRSELDDEVCRLVSRRDDPRGLTTTVYYGEPLVPDDTVNPQDAFDGWRQAERAAEERIA